MRILRLVAGLAALCLVAVLVVLGRLGAADPTVALGRSLQEAGLQRVSIQLVRADAGAASVVIAYDPQGQPAAAVQLLSRRAADLAWTSGRIEIAAVSVQPRGGPDLVIDAAGLRAAGPAATGRERYDQVQARAGRVVVLAVVAVLLTGLLVLWATIEAFRVARRPRRRRQS